MPLSQLKKASEAHNIHETQPSYAFLIHLFNPIYLSIYLAINLSRPDIQLSIYPIYKCNYNTSKELKLHKQSTCHIWSTYLYPSMDASNSI